LISGAGYMSFHTVEKNFGFQKAGED
jgi:hypothetical protein